MYIIIKFKMSTKLKIKNILNKKWADVVPNNVALKM